MNRGAVVALTVAAGLALLASYLPHLNYDDLAERLWDRDAKDDVLIGTRAALLAAAVVIASLVARRWWRDDADAGRRQRAAWFLPALVLLLVAIYLRHLRADDLLVWLWGEEGAETGDVAEAITWMRWALAVIVLIIVAVKLQALWLEFSLVTLAALMVVAAAAATGELLSHLDAKAETKKTEAAYDRGFAVPAAKVQHITRELKRDRCVRLIFVKTVDEDTADENNALTYENVEYGARLVAKLGAGKPESPVEVELGTTADTNRFATDLVASESVFIVSTDAAQETKTAPAACE